MGLSSLGQELENNFGISWLYYIRGTLKPPNEIIIVAMDNQSALQLGISQKKQIWPRDFHAKLIRHLKNQGVTAIGFDVFFRSPMNINEDKYLSEEIYNAGNVILFEYLKKNTLSNNGPNSSSQDSINAEYIIPPYKIFSDAAISMAPFPLPKVQAKISQTWLYKSELDDIATLPVAMFHLYFQRASEEIAKIMDQLLDDDSIKQKFEISRDRNNQIALALFREVLTQHSNIVQQIYKNLNVGKYGYDSVIRNQIMTLIQVYTAPTNTYINFYGPRHTITTIPYFKLLEGKGINLKNKAVFVGYSEKYDTENKDDFYSSFPDSENEFIAGVEIAATVFANLLEKNSITPLLPHQKLFLFIFWIILLVAIFWRVSPFFILPIGLLLSITYLTVTQYYFNSSAIWVPLIIPLIYITPAMMIFFILLKLNILNQEKQNISNAFKYYLPTSTVNSLAHEISNKETDKKIVYGICLATDAGQYTTLSESMDPNSLRSLMNNYYEALFSPVNTHHGTISNIIGDAMLAVWTGSKSTTTLRLNACLAAWDIQNASKKFSDINKINLPTRIGVHSGNVVLGRVGAGSHYEYRAVGDIVNTASRLEGLNKILNTDILCSEETLHLLDRIIYCPLGNFILVGKKQTVRVCEIQGIKNHVDDKVLVSNLIFKEALIAFKLQQWEQSLKGFKEILSLNEQCGPALFYQKLCATKIDRFGSDVSHKASISDDNDIIILTK